MKITHDNLIASKYNIVKSKTYGTFFNSNETIYNMHSTSITLYDSDLYNDEKIYVELANANTTALAYSFISKYGNLCPMNAILEETYYLAKNISKETSNSVPDFSSYNHFKFYQTTMHCLLDIYSILQKTNISARELLQLFRYSISLINNPYYFDFFQNEFINNEDKYEMSLNITDEYPLMQYILTLHSDTDNNGGLSYHKFTTDDLITNINQFPNHELGQFIVSTIFNIPIKAPTFSELSEIAMWCNEKEPIKDTNPFNPEKDYPCKCQYKNVQKVENKNVQFSNFYSSVCASI